MKPDGPKEEWKEREKKDKKQRKHKQQRRVEAIRVAEEEVEVEGKAGEIV